MRTFLVAASSLLILGSAIPYIVEILRGKTKPRLVSWFTWSLLLVIAFAASLADKQYPSAALLFFDAIGTLSVVVLGWRHGDRKFERFDIVCQIGAVAGLVLWLVFNSPAIAVVAALTIDFIGALPTLRHSWKKPYEETALTFGLSAAAGLCTVVIAGSWSITAMAFPLYLTLCNGLLTAVIIGRHKYAVPGEPPALREL